LKIFVLVAAAVVFAAIVIAFIIYPVVDVWTDARWKRK
jgi:hypothetical protein